MFDPGNFGVYPTQDNILTQKCYTYFLVSIEQGVVMPEFLYRDKLYYNPVEFAMDRIGGTWKMPILWRLRDKTLRYSEIRRSLNEHLQTGKVTDKMLASQLRELERHGLVERKVYPVVPPRVEYTITKRGLRAMASIEALRKFGDEARRW